MGLYDRFFNLAFAWMDPERAHNLAGKAIIAAGVPPLSCVVRAVGHRGRPARGIDVFGRTLGSRLGIAAGFDKNAEMVRGLSNLGFGFIEIGTVTAHGQPGNDKPRLFRIPELRALRNRMGFNNDGADAVAARLDRLRRSPAGKKVVLGVNIGKSKITPAGKAVDDYRYSARKLAPFADYLVINVSSPNTPGLRDLQAVSTLEPIVTAVQEAANHAAARDVPVLVKIAPDLVDEDIAEIAAMVRDTGLAGVIASNTTIGHDYGPGGLSGPMLLERGVEIVKNLRDLLGPEPVIIGVGGISTREDALAYLRAGATLVQAYTGFIYGGPLWPSRVGRPA